MRWRAFLQKIRSLPSKWVIPLWVIVLGALACSVRFLPLGQSSHYYILSPDSYFFHWLAQRVMAGQGPPPGSSGTNYTIHSGLAYPLAYIAKATGWVLGLSSADALALAAKFVSPVIGLISMALIYLFAARICSRRVGLFSALAWALMSNAVFLGSAGYLDRAGLSLLLFTTGAFLFYLSGVWHIRVGHRDVGWLISGAGVLIVEAWLYLEWSFLGVAMLLAVIAAYCVLRSLLGYIDHIHSEPDVRRRLAASMRGVPWSTLALVVAVDMVLGVLLFASNSQQVAFWYHAAIGFVRAAGNSPIVEEQGLTTTDLLTYQLFLIPLVLGLYVAWRKRDEGGIFCSCWFIALLVSAFFARRILLFATPAACLVCGVGLAFLWDWVKRGEFRMLKGIAMGALGLIAILIPFASAYSLPATLAMSPDREWQGAMAYLKDETPKDTIIMSNWNWGYWILDLGQRTPVVDNGYYGWDYGRLRDVGVTYYTADPAEAAQIMTKYGATYLVFSSLDLYYAQTIMGWAGLTKGSAVFPANSLIMQSLNGHFESGGGLEVVYRSAPAPNAGSASWPEVVILRLTQSNSP